MSHLVLLTAFLLGLAPVPSHSSGIRQHIRFEAGNSACLIEALETRSASKPLDENLSVQCGGKIVLSHPLQDAEILNVTVLGHADYSTTRIAVSWERGLVAGMTVIAVQTLQLQTSANVVFEHDSECGAEIFDDGDVLLANVGRRFLNDQILPRATNVYRWKDGRYLFEAGFQWKDDANYNDRYCIIYKPQSCPATMTTKRIPDSF